MAPTLIPPPPDSKEKAPIENVLQLTSLSVIGPDLFTNTRPLWRPPGARGIYGGAAIAQSLAAAQLTIPPPTAENGQARFYVHSMHCYFVLAGDADIPILYSVERVREGRSFMTRTVQARQRGRCIFTTTLSFVREGSAGETTVDHAAELPAGARAELERVLRAEKELDERERRALAADGDDAAGPFESRRLPLANGESDDAARWEEMEAEAREDEERWGEWGVRLPASPGSVGVGAWSIEPTGDFLLDGNHIEAIWRRDVVQSGFVPGGSNGRGNGKGDGKSDGGAGGSSSSSSSSSRTDSDRPDTKRTQSWIKARGTISPDAGHEPHLAALAYMSDSWFIGTVARVNNLWRWSSPEKQAPAAGGRPKGGKDDGGNVPKHAREMAELERAENGAARGPPRKIGMMVSLDHTIYFHRPMDIKADEWMFQEMESPWAGDGRGLVFQRIWNKEGKLLATCIQEGLVRLQQQGEMAKM